MSVHVLSIYTPPDGYRFHDYVTDNLYTTYSGNNSAVVSDGELYYTDTQLSYPNLTPHVHDPCNIRWSIWSSTDGRFRVCNGGFQSIPSSVVAAPKMITSQMALHNEKRDGNSTTVTVMDGALAAKLLIQWP